MHPASDEPPSPPFPGSDVTTKKTWAVHSTRCLFEWYFHHRPWVRGTTGCSRAELHIDGMRGGRGLRLGSSSPVVADHHTVLD